MISELLKYLFGQKDKQPSYKPSEVTKFVLNWGRHSFEHFLDNYDIRLLTSVRAEANILVSEVQVFKGTVENGRCYGSWVHDGYWKQLIFDYMHEKLEEKEDKQENDISKFDILALDKWQEKHKKENAAMKDLKNTILHTQKDPLSPCIKDRRKGS